MTSSGDATGDTNPDPSRVDEQCPDGDPAVALELFGSPGWSDSTSRDAAACTIDSVTDVDGRATIKFRCLDDPPGADPLEFGFRAAPAPSLAALVVGEPVTLWYEDWFGGQYYDCSFRTAIRVERTGGALLLAAQTGCETSLDPYPPQTVAVGAMVCDAEESCGVRSRHVIEVDLGDGAAGELIAPEHGVLGAHEVWLQDWVEFAKTYPCDQFPGSHRNLMVLRTSP